MRIALQGLDPFGESQLPQGGRMQSGSRRNVMPDGLCLAHAIVATMPLAHWQGKLRRSSGFPMWASGVRNDTCATKAFLAEVAMAFEQRGNRVWAERCRALVDGVVAESDDIVQVENHIKHMIVVISTLARQSKAYVCGDEGFPAGAHLELG